MEPRGIKFDINGMMEGIQKEKEKQNQDSQEAPAMPPVEAETPKFEVTKGGYRRYYKLTINCESKELRDYWVLEARKRGKTLSEIVVAYLRRELGEP